MNETFLLFCGQLIGKSVANHCYIKATNRRMTFVFPIFASVNSALVKH